MKTKQIIPEANVLSGQSVGLDWIGLLSELSLQNARPIDWHSHDETEIICCIKGNLRYEFTNRLNATLTSGCFLVAPAGSVHRLIDGVDGPGRRIGFFLRTREPFSDSPVPFSQAEYRDILSDILKKRFRPRVFSPALQQGLVRIADLVRNGNLTPRNYVELRTLTATALVSFAQSAAPETTKPQVRMIDEAVQWFRAHYQEKVTLDQLTAFMGYSQSRFCSLFKAHTGLPPMEWLIRYRMEKACEIMKSDECPISAVARKVGFDDPLFFSRIFKKRIGVTPSEYQRR